MSDAADEPAWQALHDELRRWERAGRTATFWWRDDDAACPTAALRHLLAIAGEHPLVLAVVPANATAELADLLRAYPAVTVWQHGWSHTNYTPDGQPDAELGDDRPVARMVRELADGKARLEGLFAAQFAPVLVPPWNRMTARLVRHLPEIGITGLSLGAGRHLALRHDTVRTGHAQIDLSDWTRGGRFIGTGEAVHAIAAHLRDRRLARLDPWRATGILTHHLVMDAATARFMERLLLLLDATPQARWLRAEEVLHPQLRWPRARRWCARLAATIGLRHASGMPPALELPQQRTRQRPISQ